MVTDEKDESSVAHITKHYSELEGKCNNGGQGRVDFMVLADSIGVNDFLEPAGE